MIRTVWIFPIDLLRDESDPVRIAAADTLGKLGVSFAVEALLCHVT